MKKLDRKKFLKLIGLSSLGILTTKIAASSYPNFAHDDLPSQKPIRVAHLTDIHIQNSPEAELGFVLCLQAVNSLPKKVDLIINGGDAIMNSALTFSKNVLKKQWTLFKSILKNENSIPVNHCIGNHDLYGWPFAKSWEREGKRIAMDEYAIKKPYYSLQEGNWKFIVLDSIQCKNSVPGYYAKLDDEQMGWLKDELENTPRNIFICIVSHVPILAVCTLFDSMNHHQKRHISTSILHTDVAELTNLFYQYSNIKSCLSGHIHMIDHVNYLGIDYYCNGAVSGSWWKGSYHQFPPSFSVMNFHSDGKVTREVHCYQWEKSA